MAIWTVLEVCCQSKNNNYWHGLNVFMAQYYGDNIHDMLDCSKNVLAAQKLSLLLWFESLYDSMIWTQCPWEGRLSQGSKSYCRFDSPTPLDVIYD